MKKTITQQLADALKDIEYKDKRIDELRDEVYQLKKNIDDRFAGQLSFENNRADDLFNANQQLMEIVRWIVNPETAKPLQPLMDKFGNIIH